MDETVARIRANGQVPLRLDGWDRASIYGWDETTGSLYAHLWRNTDDPAGPPAIRIEAGDLTPAITLAPTLSQHIAMAIDCDDPWEILAILFEDDDQEEDTDDEDDWDDEGDWDDDIDAGNERVIAVDYGSTTVTMTEGHNIRLL